MANYADLANLGEILKDVYGDGLKNQFNDETITYNQFPKSDIAPKGNGYVFGVRYSRAQGTGGRAESKKLPDPLTGTKDQAKVVPRYLYGSIRLTGPAIEIAKGDSAAFVDGLADEMDDIYQSIVVDMNRQCHWDGFGQIGRLSAAATPSTSATWAGTFDNDIGVQYFQEGQVVDLYVSAGDSLSAAASGAAGVRAYSIDPSTKVVIFESTTTAYTVNHPYFSSYAVCTAAQAIGSIAVKSGARDAAWTSADTPVEITGLTGIYDDGTNIDTFQNINADTYARWRANIISNSSVNRELTIDLMLNGVDLSRMRSGLRVSKIRMGLGQRRKYANLLMPDVRFAPTVLKGGYETLTFSGGDGSLEMIVDPMQQPNMVFFETPDAIQKFELTPLGWGNLDGSNMHRRSGYDEWDLYLRMYTNLGTHRRNGLTLLKDLVEPDLY